MSMHEPNVVNYLNIVHRYFNVIAAVRYNSYQVLEEKKEEEEEERLPFKRSVLCSFSAFKRPR